MDSNKIARILQGMFNMVPGYPSLNGLINKKGYGPREALADLQNQLVPFNGAYQDFINDRPQDWNRNAIEAALVMAPYMKVVGKKMASSLGDITGKGGYLTLSTDLKHTTPRTIAQDAGLTGRNKRDFDEIIKLQNEAINNPNKGKRVEAYNKATNLLRRTTPEVQEAVAAHTTASTTRMTMNRAASTGQTFYMEPKPEGFDTWPVTERMKYIEESTNPDWRSHMLSREEERRAGNVLYPDGYGPIYKDVLMATDMHKARQELAELRAAEEAERAAQIQMPEFVEGAYNAQPVVAQEVLNPRGPQNRYDHSRQFEDTALKEMPPVDRSGAKYYEATDPLYDIYRIWRDHPEISGDEGGSMVAAILNKELGRADRSKPANALVLSPFEAAGVINDANVSLWNSIKALRAEGKTDAQIREILAEDLNKYQGMLERYKARRDADKAQFEYDGALTNYLIGSPSEKARASEAATVDTPNYAELDLLTKFYSDILNNRK